MSARFPQHSVVLVVVALLVSAAAPWFAVGASAAASGSFGTNVVTQQQGDVVNITVDTSGAGTVNLGSPEEGFWMQVDVGGGTTTLRLNTYKAGQAGTYSLDEMVWASKGNIRSRTLRTNSLSKPLDTAQYPMNVTVGGVEQDVGAFVVEERSTNGISTRVAPKNTKIESLSATEVKGATTGLPANGTVARGDWFVLRVDATGLSGILSKDILDGNPHGVAVSFVQSNRRMNVDPNEFDGDSVERLVRTPDHDGFYLFVDASDHDIEGGDRYNVTFSVAGDSHLAKNREAVSTEVRFVERKVNLDYSGNELVVDGKTKITGKTTLAPGTTINITARDHEIPPFRKSQTMTVSGERRFAATFDFTALEPGREFEIRLRDQDQRHDAVVAGGTTVEPTTTEAPDPTTETNDSNTTEPATTDPTTTETNSTDSPETTTAPETTASGVTQITAGPLTQRTIAESSGRVPGFDALAAFLALAAAGLLAIRRS